MENRISMVPVLRDMFPAKEDVGPPGFLELHRDLQELEAATSEDWRRLREHNEAIPVPSELVEVTSRLLQVCERLDLQQRSALGPGPGEHECDLGVLCYKMQTSLALGKSPKSGSSVDVKQRPVDSRCSTSCTSSPFVSSETIAPIPIKAGARSPLCFEWFSRPGNRKYWVLRDGCGGCMTDDELVQGDIVFLTAGQVCPADSRILVQTIDAVMCKGEQRWYPTTMPTSETAIESRNMIFADTAVEAGAVFVIMLRTPPKRTYLEALRARATSTVFRNFLLAR
jgi:hypothetical protein